MTNILFTPHIPPTDDLAGVLPTWRLGEAPIFWETLQAVPMPLAGLTYPEPVMPPATGAIVLGEVVTKAVGRAPRKRTKGPGLAVAQ